MSVGSRVPLVLSCVTLGMPHGLNPVVFLVFSFVCFPFQLVLSFSPMAAFFDALSAQASTEYPISQDSNASSSVIMFESAMADTPQPIRTPTPFRTAEVIDTDEPIAPSMFAVYQGKCLISFIKYGIHQTQNICRGGKE